MKIKNQVYPTAEQVGAAAATHASQHASGGSDPITPADIGALPLSGGTMTGELKMNPTYANGYGRIRKNNSSTVDYGTQIWDYDVDENYCCIIANANRQMARLSNCENTEYDIPQLRNIAASTTDLTAGTSGLANGNIWLVYE